MMDTIICTMLGFEEQLQIKLINLLNQKTQEQIELQISQNQPCVYAKLKIHNFVLDRTGVISEDKLKACKSSHCIIFTLDISKEDSESLQLVSELKKQMHYILKSPGMADKPVLVLANGNNNKKNELPGNPKRIIVIGKKLELDLLPNKGFLQEISAEPQRQILKGLDWLQRNVKLNEKELIQIINGLQIQLRKLQLQMEKQTKSYKKLEQEVIMLKTQLNQQKNSTKMVEKKHVSFSDGNGPKVYDAKKIIPAFEKNILPESEWDHKLRLFIIYHYIKQYGKDGCFNAKSALCEHWYMYLSAINQREKFHVTKILFWVWIIWYCMHKGYKSYEEMWEKCPHLHSSSLWKQYYSDEIILRNPKARGLFSLVIISNLCF